MAYREKFGEEQYALYYADYVEAEDQEVSNDDSDKDIDRDEDRDDEAEYEVQPKLSKLERRLALEPGEDYSWYYEESDDDLDAKDEESAGDDEYEVEWAMDYE